MFSYTGVVMGENPGNSPPANYRGTITYKDGGNIPSGTLEAYLNGTFCSKIIFSDGWFGSDEEDCGADLIVSGTIDQAGQMVRFKVITDTETGWAEPKVEWQPGGGCGEEGLALTFDPINKGIGQDATLKSLGVESASLQPAFSPDIYTYTVDVPGDAAAIPRVYYQTNDEMATVQKADAKSLIADMDEARTTTLTVTAEDETTQRTYRILFNLLPAPGHCFIATAAYGSYLDPHVWALRQFRDNVLLKSVPGQHFVAWYYHNSPPLAAIIADHPTLRWGTRVLLSPLVFGVEYPAPAAGMAALLLVLAILITRQKRNQKTCS